jgi:hypothetical protein
MHNLTKNWLKIYLFYGAIFFSFGLLSLMGHDDILEQFARRINVFFLKAQSYSDLPAPEISEIPVFKPAATDAVFFYSASLPKNRELMNSLQQLLNSYCNEMESKPVDSRQSWADQMMNYASGKMVFGLNLEGGSGTLQEVELYFDFPKASEERLINRLRKMPLNNLQIFQKNQQYF